jgi:hypothetical protein
VLILWELGEPRWLNCKIRLNFTEETCFRFIGERRMDGWKNCKNTFSGCRGIEDWL